MCFLVDSSVVAPKLRPNIIYIYCCSHIEKLRGRKTIFYLCQVLVMWSISLTHLHMLSLVMWSTLPTHLHMLSFFPLCWELNLNLARAWKMLCRWAAPQALSLLFFDLTIPPVEERGLNSESLYLFFCQPPFDPNYSQQSLWISKLHQINCSVKSSGILVGFGSWKGQVLFPSPF